MEVTSQSQIKMSTFTVNAEQISDLTHQTTESGILKRQLQNDVSVTRLLLHLKVGAMF